VLGVADGVVVGNNDGIWDIDGAKLGSFDGSCD